MPATVPTGSVAETSSDSAALVAGLWPGLACLVETSRISLSEGAVSRVGDGDAVLRARIQQHWDASERGDGDLEHAIYAEDAILDYPQSGERFRGRSTIQAQRGGHPAERHFAVRRILGAGDVWVSECVITYDGAPTYSLSIMEMRDGFVTHETQYFADPFPASPSRAALAEPTPAREQ